MNRLYELEYRFDHTGNKDVQFLSDSELKELHKLYEECVEYFRKTNNRAIEQWFLLKSFSTLSCLRARNINGY